MLTASVAIPTYNRPDEIVDCIESLIGQTRRPKEIVVVDDGDLPEPPLAEECAEAGIRYIYRKKDKPGVCASRNLAMRLSTADALFFLDDDVVLFPDYVERIMEVFEADTEGRIGGVGGWVENTDPPSFAQRLVLWYEWCFLMVGWREGKMLPSGFGTDFATTSRPIRRVREVDFLPGGVSAYRREVFRHAMYWEAYSGAGMRGEDKDFSLRVKRRWRLVVNPAARLYHFPSPLMRVDKRRMGYQFVLARYRLFRDHMKRGWWSWPFFYYAVFGYMLRRAILMVFAFDWSERARLAGAIQALRETAGGAVTRHDRKFPLERIEADAQESPSAPKGAERNVS